MSRSRAAQRSGPAASAAPGGADGGRRRIALTIVAMVAISLSLGALFGKRGLLDRLRYAREHERLTTEITQLEEDVASLEEDIRALDGDRAAVERIAREELSLGKPGEAVIFLGPGPLEEPAKEPVAGPVRLTRSER